MLIIWWQTGVAAPAPVVSIRGGDDVWIKRRVQAYRKRVKEWEDAEEAYDRDRREASERIGADLRAIYERIVEGKEPASVIAATRAVAPYMVRSEPAAPPSVDWSLLLQSTEAIKDLLRAYAERDKFLRRERARRRNAALTALMLDG